MLSDVNGQKVNVLCDMGIMGNNICKINICRLNVFCVVKKNCEFNGNIVSRFCFLIQFFYNVYVLYDIDDYI